MEEEEMTIFYKDNEDILRLIDSFQKEDLGFKRGESHAIVDEIRDMDLPREDGYQDTFDQAKNIAPERPFSKKYLSEEVKRLQILEKNSDFRWAQYMAGAMGREVHEIYREDDLQRVMLEKERMREIMKADIKRTILPLREKEQALITMENERKILTRELNDLSYFPERKSLLDDGKRLLFGDDKEFKITGFMTISEMLANLGAIVSDEDEKDSPERYKLIVEEGISVESKDDVTATELERMKLVFRNNSVTVLREAVRVIWMRDYLFDAASESNIVFLLRSEPTKLRRVFDVLEDPTLSNIDNELKLASSWYELEGEEIVYLKYVNDFYDEETIIRMTKKGSRVYRDHWSNPSNYSQLMMEYLNSGEFDDDKYHLVEDQPEVIKRLLSKIFKKVPTVFTQDLEGLKQEESFKSVIQAHFLWQYFHQSSRITLAYDWHISSMRDDSLMTMSFYWSLFAHLNDLYQSVLNSYLRTIINFIQTAEIDGRKIFRINIVSKGEDGSFNNLNKEFELSTYNDWILDEIFRVYFSEQEAKFIPDQAILYRQYRAIGLHFLCQVYLNFREEHRGKKLDRLVSLERSIEETKAIMRKIASERTGMNGSSNLDQWSNPPYTQNRQFVTKTINSGLISLKPEITHFMSVAYTKVQQYCPGLRDLPLEEFQADHANECGLENDFACYVAAQIAKNGNIYQRSYKSKHHERAILTNDTETMQALKYYTYYRNARGEYKTKREMIPTVRPLEERRIVHVIRGGMLMF